MKINIDRRNRNLVWITATQKFQSEIALVEGLYMEILIHSLAGKPLSIITLAPQHYSLGYDLPSFYERKLDNFRVLINNISHLTRDLVIKIVEAEEFRRTLLLLVKNLNDPSESELSDIIALPKRKLSGALRQEIIFCEDDGNSLCLYNTNIKLPYLVSLTKGLTDNVVIDD